MIRLPLHPDKREFIARCLIYALRCAFSAVVSYVLADAAGLSMPVWAPISALIISQEKWHETQRSSSERIRGTFLGVAVSLAVNLVSVPLLVPVIAQLMLAVTICAGIARADKRLRVCMWTGPIVMLSGHTDTEPVLWAGLFRALDITIGCAVGAAFHLLTERLLPAARVAWRL
jgi:uncharacterized membrane protein YccC